MLIALVTCYNSAETIVDCLESLRGHVDKIICFDAKYKGFPYPTQYSDDETANLINNLKHNGLPVEYICLESPIDQIDARNQMITYTNYGDWLLIIDSDEQVNYWGENVKKILHNTIINEYQSIFNVCIDYEDIRHTSPTLRLYRNNMDMIRYTKDHRKVATRFGPIDLTQYPIIPLMIGHNKLAENKRMRPYMEEYKRYLIEWEAKNSNV
jgi:hypothetical protein